MITGRARGLSEVGTVSVHAVTSQPGQLFGAPLVEYYILSLNVKDATFAG